MTPQERELMQQALDALDAIPEDIEGWLPESLTDVVIALRTRLAQPEQEPVALSVRFPRHAPKHGEDWIIDPSFLLRIYHSIDPDAHYGFIPTMEEIETALLALEVIPSKLYTTPPQREWQGLTDEEWRRVMEAEEIKGGIPVKFARAIEAKLREKNNERKE